VRVERRGSRDWREGREWREWRDWEVAFGVSTWKK
jgi:hypothetical protein